jgi:hypothetical protein
MLLRLGLLFREFSDAWREFGKTSTKHMSKRNMLTRRMVLAAVKIITFIVISFLLTYFSVWLVTIIWRQGVYLWNSNLTIRVFIYITGVVTALGFFVLLFNKISQGIGGGVEVDEPTEVDKSNTWIFLQGVLFDILVKVASPLGIQSPVSLGDLTPIGTKIEKQGVSDTYIYSLLKKGEIDCNTIFNVIENELKRSQNNARMGILAEQNINGVLVCGVLCIDVTESGGYVKIELALTDANSYEIYRKRKIARANKIANNSKGGKDNEF